MLTSIQQHPNLTRWRPGEDSGKHRPATNALVVLVYAHFSLFSRADEDEVLVWWFGCGIPVQVSAPRAGLNPKVHVSWHNFPRVWCCFSFTHQRPARVIGRFLILREGLHQRTDLESFGSKENITKTLSVPTEYSQIAYTVLPSISSPSRGLTPATFLSVPVGIIASPRWTDGRGLP